MNTRTLRRTRRKVASTLDDVIDKIEEAASALGEEVDKAGGEVGAEIAARLEAAGAGPEDLAITSAAAGGDLLFLEACLARGVPVNVHLPFAEPQFLDASVGDEWRRRYVDAVRSPLVVIRMLTKEIFNSGSSQYSHDPSSPRV